ncbi:MAG: hypothetical protein CBE33_04105 [Candidatus Pelagibacter sp. TMED273]|nr:MAG: hypothetical protein CBE33_04105 [Candidatus Pelagibacter sp. TMED273]
MLISILLPTRENPNGLLRAISSINNNSFFKKKIEIIIGYDEDDIVTHNFLKKKIISKVLIKIKKLKRREGYYDLAWRYHNLAKAGNGNYNLIFNDDMTIKSKNWDLTFQKEINFLPSDNIYLSYPSHNQKNKNWPISFFLSKEWIKETKKIANSFETDTEIYVISKLLKRCYKLKKIKIHHHKKQQNIQRKFIIENKLLHPKSILNMKNFFLMLKDYALLKAKINKNSVYFINKMKIKFFFIFYIILIYKHTKINYFRVLIMNFLKKNYN